MLLPLHVRPAPLQEPPAVQGHPAVPAGQFTISHVPARHCSPVLQLPSLLQAQSAVPGVQVVVSTHVLDVLQVSVSPRHLMLPSRHTQSLVPASQLPPLLELLPVGIHATPDIPTTSASLASNLFIMPSSARQRAPTFC